MLWFCSFYKIIKYLSFKIKSKKNQYIFIILQTNNNNNKQ